MGSSWKRATEQTIWVKPEPKHSQRLDWTRCTFTPDFSPDALPPDGISKKLFTIKIVHQKFTRTETNHTVQIPYSYGGWYTALSTVLSQVNLNTIIFPKMTAGQKLEVKYYLRLCFGEKVIYLQMKNSKRTTDDFLNVWVIPYPPPRRRIQFY
ncbi:hypothetical protein F5Y08DRAFT_344949 [Xylaria arbuscula]|nr:hypothetical protein F5Y08DRAFT_344949 [Xylaria arbuscula]